MARNTTNPMLGMLRCFQPYWKHLDSVTIAEFIVNLLDCGYVVECKADTYNVMKILKDMGLIDIQYINGNPSKIIRLYKGL